MKLMIRCSKYLILINLALSLAPWASGQSSISSLNEFKNSLERMDPKDSLYGPGMHELALKYKSEGFFTLAKVAFLNGLSAYSGSDDQQSSEFAYLMADLGELYWEKGELTIAHDLYEKAEGILSAIPEESTSEKYLSLKINLAIANARLGNHLAAMVEFNQVRTLFEKEYQNQRVKTVNTIIRIADVYRVIENLQRAGSLYSEAEDEVKQINENDRKKLEISLLQKEAAFYLQSNDINKAITYQTQALENAISEYGKTSAEYSVILADLGHYYLENHEVEKANIAITEAVELQEDVFGTYHSNYLNTLSQLGDLKRLEGNFQEASTIYNQALAELVDQFSMLSPIMGVQEKSGYYLTIKTLMNKYVSLAEYSDELKSDILANTLNYKFKIDDLIIHAPPKDTDLEEFNNWKNLNERLLFLYKQPKYVLNEDQNVIAELKKEIPDLEKGLIKKNGIKIKRGHGEEVDWQDLKKKVSPDQVAVEIIRYPWYSQNDLSTPSNDVHYLFISFDADSESPGGIVLTNGNDLENKYLTHYRNSINHKFPDDYAYEMYWQPVKDYFSKYSFVILSPAGAYSQINLLTLRNIETGDYLIDEKDIDLVSNLTHLGFNDKKATSQEHEVNIFGNPEYKSNLPEQGENTDGYRIYTSEQGESGMYYMKDKIKGQILWNELLYVDDVKYYEVSLLEDLYKSAGFTTHLFTGKEANESTLKRLVNPNTLHISTHGYFMEDNQVDKNAYLDNNLLHSGLIFSGCFDYLDNKLTTLSNDDGLLTAYEITDLKLDMTELVFLSSCETGLGIVKNGNAITNFQHAFQEAGAQALIMTMWTTESEYVLEFMNLFYYHWLFEKMPKREAFLKSVRIMKDSYEKPYYWGAFIFLGD